MRCQKSHTILVAQAFLNHQFITKSNSQVFLVFLNTFQIFWLFNGLPLAPTRKSQAHYGGTLALLKISMVETADSGEYSIVAENQHGWVS